MKLKLKIKYPVCIISSLLMLMIWSCNTFKEDSMDSGKREVSVDVSGVWKIVQASRNGVDITSLMDFTRFRLNLNGDGMYSIDNYLPFITKETNGKWAIDDPVFPFRLFFSDSNGSNEIAVNLNYPVNKGKRRIILTFSAGCSSNTYSYTFEKL